MRTLPGTLALLVALAAAGACGDHPHPTDVPTEAAMALARAEAAGGPEAVPISREFAGVNPCTGEPITVSMSGTAWIHDHGDRRIVRSQRTVTTSDGFEGRGTDTFVMNGQILTFVLNDMLVHPSGARIRAHLLLVVDVTTSPPTVRVRKGTWDGTICVRS